MGLPSATVRLKGPDGEESVGIGMGTGPIDAAYKAIDSIVKVQVSQWAKPGNPVLDCHACNPILPLFVDVCLQRHHPMELWHHVVA